MLRRNPRTLLRRCLHLAPPFVVENYEPVAQSALKSGLLAQRDAEAKKELSDCRLCPRDCGVDRMKDAKGACNTGRLAVVSSAFPHFGEESVLQGISHAGGLMSL